MNYKITFDPKVVKTMGKWKKSNPILFKKLSRLLEDIAAHPRSGLGHPEAMIGGNDIYYSRHISAHDRIVYEIIDDEVRVLVIEIEGHYSDK